MQALVSSKIDFLFSYLVLFDSFMTPWTLFPIRGIFQARILEWVAISTSKRNEYQVLKVYTNLSQLFQIRHKASQYNLLPKVSAQSCLL